MPHCVACGCNNKSKKVRKEDGITFHRFPKNEALRDKWVAAVKREDWVPSNHSYLCSAHFTEEDLDRTSLSCVRLRQDVVPTVFPSYSACLKKGAKKRKQPEKAETLQPIKITCTPDHPLSQIDNISLTGVDDNMICPSPLPVPTETSQIKKRKQPEERVMILQPIKITCTPDHPLSHIDNISLTGVDDNMIYPSPLPVSTETSQTKKIKQEEEEETLQPINITCTPDHPLSPIANLSFTGVDDDIVYPLPAPTESLEAQVKKLQQVVTKQRRKIRTLQQSKLRMQKIIAKMKTIIETSKTQCNIDIEDCD